MFKSLDALVRSTVIAATLCTSSVAYAEKPSNNGAYYIDPAKRRTTEERQAAAAPPEAPADQPAEEPLPEYVQPAPPPPEQKSGKGWAWAALIGGSAAIVLGTQLEVQICEDDYRTGNSGSCKSDKSLMYLTMGSGTLLAGLGLYGVLSK